MTNDQILENLTYASTLAREGAETPLLGGRIGLMWGILLSVTLTAQWAILSGLVQIPPTNLFYLWLGFALVGGVGSAVMGRQIEKKDGAQSTANRVEKHVWTMFSVMLMALFVGVVLSMLVGQGTYTLFGVIVAVAFAGQGLAYGVVALMSDTKWLQLVSAASFVTAAISMALYGDVLVYLVGGIASLVTIVVPSVVTLQGEPRHDG